MIFDMLFDWGLRAFGRSIGDQEDKDELFGSFSSAALKIGRSITSWFRSRTSKIRLNQDPRGSWQGPC